MAGQVKAFDAATSEEVWRWSWHLPISSSVLATAGDLVFCGTPSGEFNAPSRTSDCLRLAPRSSRERRCEAMEAAEVWEAPEFEEIGVAPEVTMYVARLED
ncbi:pyrroloquinoline quinone precursor peptide PqqA [Amycolatopsis taiwanensis]|uniref:Coenzyme PQQ synthesis protein A n=1 Tax=Amycolatopsis taiwanensis TaxID=342230 RepID=A0A9W6QZL2_9PSEU|nr:pyrroloquinoline quinone precursor peptide PqqA [Amycolatopsis taiwanensis]GLY65533.1 hypothetical protein Atai01_21520 [Amycolatopsis taiwanensis]